MSSTVDGAEGNRRVWNTFQVEPVDLGLDVPPVPDPGRRVGPTRLVDTPEHGGWSGDSARTGNPCTSNGTDDTLK